MIRCQHQWVEQCQLRYKVEPPSGYHFENAHYPLSEKLGGTKTVPLWYPDHIIQGCLQTLAYDYPCIDTRKEHTERNVVKNVYPEYLSLYEEAYSLCKRYSGVKRGKQSVEMGLGIHGPGGRQAFVETYRSNGLRMRDEKRGLFDPVYKEKIRKARSEATSKTNKQKWKSTVDGFISNAAAVAKHNKVNGWDPNARIKIS